jgi:PadR family transcriptional regulator
MPRYQGTPRLEAELLQGTLDMLILKVVEAGPIHGYAIVQRIQQISKQAIQVRQGSLYPALHRLEDHGVLKAEWHEAESGRKAKFYALTRIGRKRLEEEKLGWNRLSDAIRLVMQPVE